MYDHEKRTIIIVYFPPDSLIWAPHRFCELTIREVIEYRPAPRYGIGLIPTIPNPDFAFPPGTHEFRFWYRQLSVDSSIATTPDVWNAQRTLIETVMPLLDPEPTLIPDAPGWDVMAHRTLNDLENEACWITAGSKTGLRAYVKGSSAVGRDQAQGFELMTQLDVLLPLLHWRNQTGEQGADPLIERLLEAVRAYQIIEPYHYLTNHYPYQSTDTFMDTWYFYENALIKLPWVAYLTGDADLKRTFLSALEGGKHLARKTNYLMPLFADAKSWEPKNSLLNVSVSGMYAAGNILAYQMTGDSAYLPEAEKALNAVYHLPTSMLTHEPQQLSFTAAAAQWLRHHYSLQGKPEAATTIGAAADFVLLALRMGYWGKDPMVPFYDPRGMFQACASLSYPAFKENVEVIWAWSELLKTHQETPHHNSKITSLMLTFANLQRCHNYAFFDPFLPESMQRGPCAYIPYEDLATTEFPYTATLGKELYGAGEVFWSALLFARPGFLQDIPADLLTFSLNVPCLRMEAEANMLRRWIIYNPRQTSVEILNTGHDMLLEPRSFQIMEGV
jgi:hypothetical protein